MKIRHLLSALFALLATSMQAQNSSIESWSGALNLGAQRLQIGFDLVTAPDGQTHGTMDVPEQGAFGLPVEVMTNRADTLRLAIPALQAEYVGLRAAEKRIEGTFTQRGYAFELILHAGKIQLHRPQTPALPYPYRSEEVRFTNEKEGAVLSGTLTYPVGYDARQAAQTPVVLLVTGSGAQNRDEEIFGHKPFLVIADYLARHGIATLRYDDRGVGQSSGPTTGTTTLNNLADAEAGIAALRQMGQFGAVGVLGHSEGGTIALMMGAKGSVDFVVSLAGGAVDGITLIVGQNAAILQQQGLPKGVVEAYCRALGVLYRDRVAQVPVFDAKTYVETLCAVQQLTLPEPLKANLAQCMTAGGAWITWFLGYDPAEAIGQIRCPVLALNGTLDMQVLSSDNLPVLRKQLPADERHLVKEYEGLNHLFQHCTPATAMNYGAIAETISEEVLHDIVAWVKSCGK